MGSPDWWYHFLKHSKAASKSKSIPTAISEQVNSTLKFFHSLIENKQVLDKASDEDIKIWIANAERLHKALTELELQTGHPTKRSFFNSFAKSIASGLEYASQHISFESTLIAKPQSQRSSASLSRKITLASKYGKALTEMKKHYVQMMESLHESKKSKGLKETDADEADRLNSFSKVAAFWLMRLHALEFAADILKHNLELEEYPLEKDPLPLQFRLEQDTSIFTFRLIKASIRKPVPEDISILDIIEDCYAIPVFNKDGMDLVDDPEVIRFVRLHSEKDNLLVFLQDNLSQLAQQMYQVLLNTIKDINRYVSNVVKYINQTPLQDLEHAFAGINPEECRTLLRKKFQSMLPGINERHYREETKKEKSEQSVRTQETMEDFHREFLNLKSELFGSLKSTLATMFWLRRVLTSTLRSNWSLEQKQKGDGKKKELSPSQPDPTKHLMVGASLTIGDEDIAKFYINPDDVVSSQISVQRADKADKWIAVRKSDKTHRILKKDFFGVIKRFIEGDLNPALADYGFNEVDLNSQLLPEIQERLADEHRIDLIRSSILGTIITNLEEFRDSEEFQKTLRRYFKKPDYDNLHYPTAEKMAQVARGLTHSSTSILQMKYRRVLRVKAEIKTNLDRLNDLMDSDSLSPRQSQEYQEDLKQSKALLGVINKVQQIMIYARPSLTDVKLEPDDDYIVVKPGE